MHKEYKQMNSTTVTIETEMPEDVYQTLQAHGMHREQLVEQMQHLLAMRLYRDRALSLGQAARLAGLSRWDFIELLSINQIPVIDYSDEELEDEFKAVERLSAEDMA